MSKYHDPHELLTPRQWKSVQTHHHYRSRIDHGMHREGKPVIRHDDEANEFHRKIGDPDKSYVIGHTANPNYRMHFSVKPTGAVSRSKVQTLLTDKDGTKSWNNIEVKKQKTLKTFREEIE